MTKESDFIQAKATLKASIKYQGTYADLAKFNKKDEFDNSVEDWDLFISKQEYQDEDTSIFMCLVRRNDEGKNILQLNFEDMTMEDLSNFIKQLSEVYKARLKYTKPIDEKER